MFIRLLVYFHFDGQEESLDTMGSLMPDLYEQHGTLGFALDTTRHQLPIKAVHLPDNEQQFQGNN